MEIFKVNVDVYDICSLRKQNGIFVCGALVFFSEPCKLLDHVPTVIIFTNASRNFAYHILSKLMFSTQQAVTFKNDFVGDFRSVHLISID